LPERKTLVLSVAERPNLKDGLHWGLIVDLIQTSPIWTNKMA
jgi:hypothetical protein